MCLSFQCWWVKKDYIAKKSGCRQLSERRLEQVNEGRVSRELSWRWRHLTQVCWLFPGPSWAAEFGQISLQSSSQPHPIPLHSLLLPVEHWMDTKYMLVNLIKGWEALYSNFHNWPLHYTIGARAMWGQKIYLPHLMSPGVTVRQCLCFFPLSGIKQMLSAWWEKKRYFSASWWSFLEMKTTPLLLSK